MNSLPIFPSKNFTVLFLAAIAIILLMRIGELPLKFEEPRRALVATEMMISGNYIAPTINGEFYYNKPPLFNWILVGVYSVFGHHEWAERLPTYFSIIGLALLNFYFFRKKIGQEVAGLASLFFVLAGHMLFYFSFQGEIDMTYSFVVYCQVITIIYFFERKQYWQLFLVSYLLMVAGFMMKGLPSIAFQGLTLLGIFIGNKRFLKLFHVSHFISFFATIGLLAGYFLLYADYNNPELLLARLTTESARRTAESGGILSFVFHLVKFPLLVLMLMLPWSLLTLKFRKVKNLLENKWVKYMLLFLAFNLPLYWISVGVRDRYLYMFLPFLLNILVFITINEIRKNPPIFKYIVISLASILIVAFVVLPIVQPVSILFSGLLISILIGIALLTQTKKIHPVFGLMLIMLSTRFYYNEVVFDARNADPKNIEAYAPAFKILELTKNEKVYFVSKKTKEYAKLPLRQEIIIEEIERLPYQLSYYYSSRANQILEWKSEEPTSGFFLKSGNDSRAIYSFKMEGRDFSLVKK